MTIAELLPRLTTDYWRATAGFSPEMQTVQDRMLQPGGEAHAAELLRGWLQKHQPCLFGRFAARLDLLTICILTEDDLQCSDEFIRDKIQEARAAWTRQAFEGRKSGFVIVAISPRLANAAPDATLKQLALRLCSLYLLEDIEPDVIYYDDVFLEKPGSAHTTWNWRAGVNVFSANADGRWWQDHRIPGGLGFSVNSVGHMAKSGMLARVMHDMDDLLGGTPETLATSKITSLEDALEWAMRTIWGATNAVSGKATELLPLASDPGRLPVSKCPVQLPEFLCGYNYCEYQGYYHTDVTVPSSYFSPDVTRPAAIRPLTLDLTYLFDARVDNPAFQTMGRGRRVRGLRGSDKIHKGKPLEASVESIPRLARAIGR